MDYSGERSAVPGGRGPLLVLNFLPARFDGRVDVGTLPFETPDKLRAIREELRTSHVVVNRGKDVVCVPFVSGAKLIGKRTTITAAGPDLVVQTSLLESSLRRTLTEKWKYELRRESPLTFVSRTPGRDLLEKALGRELPGLHVFPAYSLDVRRYGPGGFPGVVVGLKTRYEIDLPVGVLLRRGVQVNGLYVLAESPSAPAWPFQDAHTRRRLVGQVVAVDGDKLRVRCRDGEMELDAAEAWIEPNTANFYAVLRKACGRSYERDFNALEAQVVGLTNAQQRIADTNRIAANLIGLGKFDISNGMTAELGTPLRLTSTQHPHVRTLAEPTFVFDQSGDKTAPFPETGLTKWGPLDAESFTPKAPHIAVVVPRQFQGRVETLVERFRNGVRGSNAYAEGFVRKFRLTDCTFSFTVFDGDAKDAAAYRQACLTALSSDEQINLAFVFTSAVQEHQTGDDSPYLVSKSTFMSQGIPVQEYQVENITGDSHLAYPLSTMALACYAKLGGTPYAISDRGRPMARELIFGIGSAQISDGRMGEAERFVGITTVFNYDGRYLVSNVSRETPYERYPQALLDALRTCIADVKVRQGWRSDDFVRLIFHIFKPLKDKEARAVKELVTELTSEYASVEFAFVTVVDDHPWLVLDENSDGVKAGRGTKGKRVARRGFALPISKHELLVTVKGPREMKSDRQGAPKPLLLKLHRESTFTDIDYLAGQVFQFTAMSWRRPYPTSKPVTISYSDLIAGLLGKLRHVTNWNSDMIYMKLRFSRWFL
ncbi:argonaute/piwi family protein [Nocardia asiatica]|uniref:argonaute/piwi family protein n=1 Tax=Nocardia asiatica TaxID=209252 RepID=UPI0024582E72|nr:Piwi domain-containing protein [Nocardia asiatica]